MGEFDGQEDVGMVLGPFEDRLTWGSGQDDEGLDRFQSSYFLGQKLDHYFLFLLREGIL
jgi:hypothetical protein